MDVVGGGKDGYMWTSGEITVRNGLGGYVSRRDVTNGKVEKVEGDRWEI